MTDPTPAGPGAGSQPDEPAEPRDLPEPVADPPTTRRATPTRSVHLAANGARFRYVTRRPTFWVVLAVVLLTVAALAAAFHWRLGTALGWLTFAALFYVWAAWRQGLRAYAKIYPLGQEMSADLAPAGLTLRTEAGSYSTGWSRYAAAYVINDQLVLPLRGSPATLVIPSTLLHEDAYAIARDGIRDATHPK